MIVPQRQPGKFMQKETITLKVQTVNANRSGLESLRQRYGMLQYESSQNYIRCGLAAIYARFHSVAPERARKIAAKNRSSMPTGIGGSFQLANSASPLGVIDSASAPTARIETEGA